MTKAHKTNYRLNVLCKFVSITSKLNFHFNIVVVAVVVFFLSLIFLPST